MTAALERCECSAERPCLTLPPGKTRYPFYRRLGGLQDRSGRAEDLPGVVLSKVLERLRNMIKHGNLRVSLLHVRWLKILQQVFRNDILTDN